MTRELVPPSLSSPPPEPKLRSPSSMITAIGPMALTVASTRSRLASVEPTHLERKFFSATADKPASFKNALMTKVLPEPMGPTASRPIGVRVVSPLFRFLAIASSACLMCSCPPTDDKSCLGSMNSIKPAHSFSIISRLRA